MAGHFANLSVRERSVDSAVEAPDQLPLGHRLTQKRTYAVDGADSESSLNHQHERALRILTSGRP